MKFIYDGTHRDTGASDGNEASSITAYGVTFPKGVPVEVTDEFAVRKLSWNGSFRPVPDEPASVTQPEIVAVSVPEFVKSEPENASLAAAPVPRKRGKKGAE